MIKVIVLVLVLATNHVWSSTSNDTTTTTYSDQVHCMEWERQALLSLKQGFVDELNILSSWKSTQRDCCAWSGIRCDNLTHHVISLDLHSYKLGGEIGQSLVDLQHLRYLDLSFNEFTKILKFIGSLTRLKSLNFVHNPLMSIPSELGNLTRLRLLKLSSSHYYISTDLEWLSHLSSLRFLTLSRINVTKSKDWLHSFEIAPSLTSLELYHCLFPPIDYIFTHKNSSNSLTNLHISDCTIPPKTIPWLLNMSINLVNITCEDTLIKGPLPNSFGNMRSLTRLNFAGNGFEGELPKSLGNLCNLQELVLTDNKFNATICGVIGSLIGCANNLKILDLSSNQFKGPLPEGIGELQQLEHLDLSSNSFSGTLPESIGKLQHLKNLYLFSNSLSGLVTEVHFQTLSKLKRLVLSGNSLIMKVNSTWIPPFQLDWVYLGSCKLGPQFPTWLKTQINISLLDLSNSQIHGEIPNWFLSQTPKLKILNLSSNQLRGPIPPCLPNVTKLILSNNSFINLKKFLCDSTKGSIRLLDISNNMLNGSLPDCQWNTKDLIILKLDNNSLSGVIPRSIGLLSKIQLLLLGRNNFSGNLPSSLKNCTELKVLDVEYNNLKGNLPSWIGERLTNLIFLRMRSNNFYGVIPSNLCHLQLVQILDLSMNNIVGTIPSCFENFTSMMYKRSDSYDDDIEVNIVVDNFSYIPFDMEAIIMWKGACRKYGSTLGLLRVIDISCNNLIGKIPEGLTNLVELVQLNLSRNNLSSTIPMEIGNLTKLESLDLSHNNLCGVIPISLASISSLSFLDLSSNKLSGRISTGTQLQSFNYSTYIDNYGLCGQPLTNLCPGDVSLYGSQDHLSGVGDYVDDSEKWFDISQFYMGIEIGFVIGFFGVYGYLFLNASWRCNYFDYMDTVGDWSKQTY